MRVLSPRGRPVRFAGPNAGGTVDLDGWPGGTTLYRSQSAASVYGVVARSGRFERVGRFEVPFSGLWSADGSAYAYTDYDTEEMAYWVRPLDGESVQLLAPGDVPELRIVGWESAGAVVLWYFNDYSTPASLLVRCSTTTGACERVPDGPVPGRPATMSSRY